MNFRNKAESAVGGMSLATAYFPMKFISPALIFGMIISLTLIVPRSNIRQFSAYCPVRNIPLKGR